MGFWWRIKSLFVCKSEPSESKRFKCQSYNWRKDICIPPPIPKRKKRIETIPNKYIKPIHMYPQNPLPIFNGNLTEDPKDFIDDWIYYAKENGWDAWRMYNRFPKYLKGLAHCWYREKEWPLVESFDSEKEVQEAWRDLVNKFLGYFTSKERMEEIQWCLRQIRQEPDEDISSFLKRFGEYAYLIADPNFDILNSAILKLHEPLMKKIQSKNLESYHQLLICGPQIEKDLIEEKEYLAKCCREVYTDYLNGVDDEGGYYSDCCDEHDDDKCTDQHSCNDEWCDEYDNNNNDYQQRNCYDDFENDQNDYDNHQYNNWNGTAGPSVRFY